MQDRGNINPCEGIVTSLRHKTKGPNIRKSFIYSDEMNTLSPGNTIQNTYI